MSENEDFEAQDVLADLVEADAQSGLTHEQALAELAKVRKEAAKHRVEKQTHKAALEELQKYKDAEKSELERVAERAQRAEAELTQLRREKVVRDAAKTAGLDSEWVDDVRGDTEEEILASAYALAERLGKLKSDQVPAGFSSAGGQPVKAPESAASAFRDYFMSL